MSMQISVSEITLKFDRIENVGLDQLVFFPFQNQTDNSDIRTNLDNSLISNKLILRKLIRPYVIVKKVRIYFTVYFFYLVFVSDAMLLSHMGNQQGSSTYTNVRNFQKYYFQ